MNRPLSPWSWIVVGVFGIRIWWAQMKADLMPYDDINGDLHRFNVDKLKAGRTTYLRSLEARDSGGAP